MARFAYKAATSSGDVVEGEMEAASRDAVIRRLQAQGQVPIRAEEATGAVAALAPRRRGRRVRESEVHLLTIELATLLEAGVSVDKALEMLARLGEGRALGEVLRELMRAVRSGKDLSVAMEAHPRVFPAFYRNMVRAGEASGALEAALGRLADFMGHGRELRDTIVSALVYPLVLVGVAVVSLSVILGFVVPRIAQMFEDAGERLPLPTRIVVEVGAFLHAYGWLVAIALVGVWLVARQRYRIPRVRLQVDRWFASLPIAGDLIARLEAARFTRTLGTLLKNGVDLLDALRIATASLNNQHIANAIARIEGRVRGGQGLARPLAEAGVFPTLTSHLVEVGEETGQLEDMLGRLADIYEREVRERLRRIVALVEPALILGLGAVIAGVIMSIVLAILNVNQIAF